METVDVIALQNVMSANHRNTSSANGWPNCLLSFGFVFIVLNSCLGQTRDVVCRDGYGKFETKFVSGVSVSVGAAKGGGLAKRSCAATLAWDGRDLPVAAEVSQVDIDVLGADLGLGVPVVAFEVKKTAADWDTTYRIYSLKKPPKLLRTIAGGDFFSAADTNLNGKTIEIWTSDVLTMNGFEGLDPGELDFAPMMVLRFEGNRLLDVSAEFKSHFDEQIAKVRSELSAQDLSDFRGSDGKSATPSLSPPDRMHRLRITKIKVLEIVWSYLYSGRDQEAWRALADMWPPKDVDRIRAAILNARARGIRSQLDGASAKQPRVHFKKHAYVFDAVTEAPQANGDTSLSSTPGPCLSCFGVPLPLAIENR